MCLCYSSHTCLVTASIADHLVCTPLFPACWLHTVEVARAKRPLFSGSGAVYGQRLPITCDSDGRCLRQPWPDCGPFRYSSHLTSSSSPASAFIWMPLILFRAKWRLCGLQLEGLADSFTLPQRPVSRCMRLILGPGAVRSAHRRLGNLREQFGGRG